MEEMVKGEGGALEMGTSRKLITLMSLISLWVLPGETEMVIPQTTIEVNRGQKVILQASYTSNTDISKNVVIWNFKGSIQVVGYTPDGESISNIQFYKRVDFLNTMPSTNLSIVINNTQEQDSGQYTCQVIIPNNTGAGSSLQLIVNVPPSVPECTITGRPVLHGNITLNCNSKEGKPAPQYKWVKSSPNTGVFFPPMLNEQLGTLKLNNLSSDMSGKYSCNAINSAGSGSCFVEVTVSTATDAGVIAGATVGAVLGLLALVLFVLFILRRRKDSEEDIANDIKEDAQAPKRVSWAKSGSGSDIISKNGTLSSIATSHHPHDHLQSPHYAAQPFSDSSSIITTGSTAGYRPGQHARAGHNAYSTAPHRGATGTPATNGGSLQRTSHSPPQAVRPPPGPAMPTVPPVPTVPTIATGVSASNISRMGGVPIMVPAQNQAGSLV